MDDDKETENEEHKEWSIQDVSDLQLSQLQTFGSWYEIDCCPTFGG